jgi:hypothetical protein
MTPQQIYPGNDPVVGFCGAGEIYRSRLGNDYVLDSSGRPIFLHLEEKHRHPGYTPEDLRRFRSRRYAD